MRKIIAIFAVVLAVCIFCLSAAPSYALAEDYFPTVDVRDVTHVNYDLEMLNVSGVFYTNPTKRISLNSNALADTKITLFLQVREVNLQTGATRRLYLKNMGMFNANENVPLNFILDDVLSFRFGYEFTFIIQAPGGDYYTLDRDMRIASYLGYLPQVYKFGKPFYSVPNPDAQKFDFYTVIGSTVCWAGYMSESMARIMYGELVFKSISEAMPYIKTTH